MARGMMSGWLLGIALAVLSALPLDAGAQRKGGAVNRDAGVEASMLVTGRVTVERDGSLGEWSIDRREELPAAVVNVIEAAAPGWRFEPVVFDGEPVRGYATMSLLMVAEPVEEGRFRVVIRNSYFGRNALAAAGRSRDSGADTGVADDQVRALQMPLPEYPRLAAVAAVQGTAYIVVLVDRTGRVQKAEVEQVNLRAHGSEQDMAKMRYLLGDAALGVTRRWRFQPPGRGESADDDKWSVRVPVEYLLEGGTQPGYGDWQVYIPGPRSRPSWLDEAVGELQMPPDALVPGHAHQLGMGLKMLQDR